MLKAIRLAHRGHAAGKCLTVTTPELPQTRKLYLERYENSKHWVDFEDFSFIAWRSCISITLAASEYGASQPDPLADTVAGIIGHMNANSRSACAEFCRHQGRGGYDDLR